MREELLVGHGVEIPLPKSPRTGLHVSDRKPLGPGRIDNTGRLGKEFLAHSDRKAGRLLANIAARNSANATRGPGRMCRVETERSPLSADRYGNFILLLIPLGRQSPGASSQSASPTIFVAFPIPVRRPKRFLGLEPKRARIGERIAIPDWRPLRAGYTF
jgi:hypothetical protein